MVLHHFLSSVGREESLACFVITLIFCCFFLVAGKPKNPEHFVYNDEAMLAWKEGRLSDDIKEEHRKVEQADLIIFQVPSCVSSFFFFFVFLMCERKMKYCFELLLQFPLYWFSFPAIMKGWVDRVLTQGFAFSLQNLYDNGMFKVWNAHTQTLCFKL